MNKQEMYKKASDDFAFLLTDLREIYTDADNLEDLLIYAVMEKAANLQKELVRIYNALEVTNE